MTGAAGLSPRAWDGRLRHSRDQEDPLLLMPLTHHHDNDDDDDHHHHKGEDKVVRNAKSSYYIYWVSP